MLVLLESDKEMVQWQKFFYNSHFNYSQTLFCTTGWLADCFNVNVQKGGTVYNHRNKYRTFTLSYAGWINKHWD